MVGVVPHRAYDPVRVEKVMTARASSACPLPQIKLMIPRSRPENVAAPRVKRGPAELSPSKIPQGFRERSKYDANRR